MPENCEASAGRGGVGMDYMENWGYSQTIKYGITFQKRPEHDRSHKFLYEGARRA